MTDEAPETAWPLADRSRPAVTLREVAQRAGVSTMTVSRAIHAPHRVTAPLRQRVDEAVRVLGYVPNLMANGLRSARSHLVMALVPTITGSLFSEMVRSLTEALESQGYQLMVGQIGYGRSREDELLKAIIGRRPDGIVLAGILHSPEARSMLVSSGIPVVETWDTTDTPIDMLLRLSHEQIGREVCRHLHASGRRHLALLSGRDERAELRERGYLAQAAEFGLQPPVVYRAVSPTTHGQGRDGLDYLLRAAPQVDGIFCSSDLMATGVLTQARVRGIAVPEKLGVVGFGDLDFASTVVPSLTSVHIDGAAIGGMAARMIADCADGRAPARRIVDIQFSIVGRDSG